MPDVRLHGEVLRVAYHDPRSWQARLVVAMDDGVTVVVDGRVPLRPYPGMMAEVSGDGALEQGFRRVKGAEIDLRAPAGGRARARYIAALMRGMPDDLVKRAAEYPGDLGGALVPTLPFRTAVALRERWRDALVPLRWSRSLVEHGVARDRAARVARRALDEELDPVALAVEDPYQIFALGASWTEAERLASVALIPQSDFRRVSAGVARVLQQAESRGATGIDRGALLADAEKLLGVEGHLIEGAVRRGVALEELEERNGFIQRAEIAKHEREIAQQAARLLALPAKPFEEPANWGMLNRDQQQAVRHAYRYRIVIVTGDPGCGKTTTLKQLLERWDGDTLQCAPTGTAAFRMEQATGARSSTMHSALKAMRTAAGWRFQHGANSPFGGRDLLVAADELSMVDVETAASFLGGIPPDGHVFMLGDIGQIPSVGPGAVMRDLMAAGVPTVTLTQGYRMNAPIARFATHVKHRRLEGALEAIDGDTVRHLPVGHAATTAQEVVRLLNAGAKLRDIAVLSPAYAGANGVHALNAALKRRLNPAACEEEGGRLPGVPIVRHWERPANSSEEISVPIEAQFMAPGDRVITREPDLYSRNGEAGVVMACGLARDREPWMEVLSDDGVLRKYEGTEVQRLDLAYARTVHRSQGDQYKHVFLALSGTEGHLLDAAVLYTGFTRAQETLAMVAPPVALHDVISGRFDHLRVRETTLVGRLREALRLRAPQLAAGGIA